MTGAYALVDQASRTEALPSSPGAHLRQFPGGRLASSPELPSQGLVFQGIFVSWGNLPSWEKQISPFQGCRPWAVGAARLG